MAPYWGPITATIDWCESNYQVPFIAELWNTLSNVVIIFPCIFGLYKCFEYCLPLRYWLAYVSLCIVGIGSWMFHMTLLWSMQLLDELPMIYCGSVFLYCVIERFIHKQWQRIVLALFLIIYAIIITFMYIHPDSIVAKYAVFHELAYACQVLGIMIGCVLSAKTPRDKKLCMTALGSYLVGSVFWLSDNYFCGALQAGRARVGSMAPLLQFHALWHVGVGIGSYLALVFVISSRLESRGLKPRLQGSVLPYVHFSKGKLL